MFIVPLLVLLLAQQQPPDSVPGALNAAVTQSNIHETICVPGYSKSVRPSEARAWQAKHRLLIAAHMPLSASRTVTADHRVPLEVGGAPRDTRNIWLQPYEGGQAAAKDQLENIVHREVCAGRMTLHEGQEVFLGRWWESTAYQLIVKRQGHDPDQRLEPHK